MLSKRAGLCLCLPTLLPLQYERRNITAWFAGSLASPVTGAVVEDTRLVGVTPVAAAIREWCVQHGVVI